MEMKMTKKKSYLTRSISILVVGLTFAACGAEWSTDSEGYGLQSQVQGAAGEVKTLNVNLKFSDGKLTMVSTLQDALQVHHECPGAFEAWCEGADGSCSGCKTFRECSSCLLGGSAGGFVVIQP